MSFVTTSPANPIEEAPIGSGSFWPVVDPAAVREAQRIDGTIAAPRLREALITAIGAVNRELIAYRAINAVAGYATLADVPAEEIDSVSVHVHSYYRAVGCLAKANLIERYRDYDTTAAGNKKADQMENPTDDLRRDARWAISDIRGIGRTTVELI